jgi:two-component system, chemotaxis family, response regulator Rcp1
LIVEDNAGDIRLMREAFSPHARDVELSILENGEIALEYLKKSGPFDGVPSPHLIFLDLNLPRRDGRDVLREIKADDKLKRIPVIIFTTSESPADVRKAYDLHANCYIRKPSDLQRFFEVIDACKQFWLRVVKLASC